MRRPERLAESLREEISEVVGFELDDPRLVAVTVTDVEVAKDLRDAKVYVLVRGSKLEVEAALSTLRHAATYIRQQVAMNLDMRFAPHIHFVRDTAEENASRVTEVLGELEARGELNKEQQVDQDGPAVG
jgi:ribosome-binding factor A